MKHGIVHFFHILRKFLVVSLLLRRALCWTIYVARYTKVNMSWDEVDLLTIRQSVILVAARIACCIIDPRILPCN